MQRRSSPLPLLLPSLTGDCGSGEKVLVVFRSYLFSTARDRKLEMSALVSEVGVMAADVEADR